MYVNIPIWADNPSEPLANAALTGFDHELDEYGKGKLFLVFSAHVDRMTPSEFSKLQSIAYQAIADYARNNGLEVLDNGSIGLRYAEGDGYMGEEEEHEDDPPDYNLKQGRRFNPFS